MLKNIKEYSIINIGLLLVALEVHFILVPNKLITGGVSGLAIIINNYVPSLSIGAIMMMCNLALFIIGFIFIGFEFGAKTIYSSFAISGMVWVLQKICPISQPLVDDMLLQLILAMILLASGIAIIFNQNASTGGTDIIAKIINKYFHLDIGKALLLSDLLIVLSAGFVFDIKLCMYGILGVILNGTLIDQLLQNFTIAKEIVIITNNSTKIKNYIVGEIGRGATIYHAKGAFTNDNKEIVRSIMTKKELMSLKKYIQAAGLSTFITVNNVNEIFGEGFVALK